MNPTRPDRNVSEPLTPVERAWAERLARIGPSGGPPPALDARILAAAHAAASTRHPKRRAARWPALLGLAATIALAVGVAWQLRPLVTVPGIQDEVPSAAPVAATATMPDLAADAPAKATTTAAGSVAAEPPPAPGEVRTAPALRQAPPRQPAPAEAPVPSRQQETSAATPPASPASPKAVTAPLPAPEPIAFPARAPPASPPPAARAAKGTAAMQEDAATRPRLDRSAAMPQQNAAPETMAGDARAETSAAAPASAVAAMPAVAEDRRLAPPDWLQRIRERRDLGDTAAARDSLALFRQMHPGIAVPADLRTLDASPTPADD